MTNTKFFIVVIGAILVALGLYWSKNLTDDTKFVGNNEVDTNIIIASNDIDHEPADLPLKSSNDSKQDLGQGVSSSINSEVILQGSGSSASHASISQLPSQANHKSGVYQLERLARQYGLRFLPESNIGGENKSAAIRRNSLNLARQLTTKNDDEQLVALARQTGVSTSLTRRFEAELRYLNKSQAIQQRASSLTAYRGRAPVPKSEKDQRWPSNQRNADPNVSRPQPLTTSAEQLVSITRSIESLRRNLIVSTSRRIAEMQLKRRGSNN